jgi:hypothetical protein
MYLYDFHYYVNIYVHDTKIQTGSELHIIIGVKYDADGH